MKIQEGAKVWDTGYRMQDKGLQPFRFTCLNYNHPNSLDTVYLLCFCQKTQEHKGSQIKEELPKKNPFVL